MRIITFAGSVRTGSHNQKLVRAAAEILNLRGADVIEIRLSDFPLPLMDVDLQVLKGIPETALDLGRIIAGADGLFVSSPEYNASIPPLLKNAIDWVSRISELDGAPVRPWRGKTVALGAASPGKFGGVQALPHLRAVFQAVSCLVIAEQVSISMASAAFDAEGRLIDAGGRRRLEVACDQLLRYAAA